MRRKPDNPFKIARKSETSSNHIINQHKDTLDNIGEKNNFDNETIHIETESDLNGSQLVRKRGRPKKLSPKKEFVGLENLDQNNNILPPSHDDMPLLTSHHSPENNLKIENIKFNELKAENVAISNSANTVKKRGRPKSIVKEECVMFENLEQMRSNVVQSDDDSKPVLPHFTQNNLIHENSNGTIENNKNGKETNSNDSIVRKRGRKKSKVISAEIPPTNVDVNDTINSGNNTIFNPLNSLRKRGRPNSSEANRDNKLRFHCKNPKIDDYYQMRFANLKLLHCIICKKDLDTLPNLLKHAKTCTKAILCEMCKNIETNWQPAEFLNHILKQHNGLDFVPDYGKFDDYTDFWWHLYKSMGNALRCFDTVECGKSFSTFQGFSYHCKHCPKLTDRTPNLRDVMKNSISTTNDSHLHLLVQGHLWLSINNCLICYKKFDPKDLSTHMKECPTNSIICLLCPALQFTDLNEKCQHLLTVHNGLEKRLDIDTLERNERRFIENLIDKTSQSFACLFFPQCTKTFTTFMGWNYHTTHCKYYVLAQENLCQTEMPIIHDAQNDNIRIIEDNNESNSSNTRRSKINASKNLQKWMANEDEIAKELNDNAPNHKSLPVRQKKKRQQNGHQNSDSDFENELVGNKLESEIEESSSTINLTSESETELNVSSGSFHETIRSPQKKLSYISIDKTDDINGSGRNNLNNHKRKDKKQQSAVDEKLRDFERKQEKKAFYEKLTKKDTTTRLSKAFDTSLSVPKWNINPTQWKHLDNDVFLENFTVTHQSLPIHIAGEDESLIKNYNYINDKIMFNDGKNDSKSLPSLTLETMKFAQSKVSKSKTKVNMYVGGHVSAIEWAPYTKLAKQYQKCYFSVAVNLGKDKENLTTQNDTAANHKSPLTMIQIWSCNLSKVMADPELFRLEYSFAVIKSSSIQITSKEIRGEKKLFSDLVCMKWCPNYTEIPCEKITTQENAKDLGLLAVTWQNFTPVIILPIPHPSTLYKTTSSPLSNSQNLMFFITNNYYILDLNFDNHIQTNLNNPLHSKWCWHKSLVYPTSIDWFLNEQYCSFATGYSDGTISVWHLTQMTCNKSSFQLYHINEKDLQISQPFAQTFNSVTTQETKNEYHLWMCLIPSLTLPRTSSVHMDAINIINFCPVDAYSLVNNRKTAPRYLATFSWNKSVAIHDLQIAACSSSITNGLIHYRSPFLSYQCDSANAENEFNADYKPKDFITLTIDNDKSSQNKNDTNNNIDSSSLDDENKKSVLICPFIPSMTFVSGLWTSSYKLPYHALCNTTYGTYKPKAAKFLLGGDLSMGSHLNAMELPGITKTGSICNYKFGPQIVSDLDYQGALDMAVICSPFGFCQLLYGLSQENHLRTYCPLLQMTISFLPYDGKQTNSRTVKQEPTMENEPLLDQKKNDILSYALYDIQSIQTSSTFHDCDYFKSEIKQNGIINTNDAKNIVDQSLKDEFECAKTKEKSERPYILFNDLYDKPIQTKQIYHSARDKGKNLNALEYSNYASLLQTKARFCPFPYLKTWLLTSVGAGFVRLVNLVDTQKQMQDYQSFMKQKKRRR